MQPSRSFLWHDYETFGTDPALDRPAQFAALRTDENLEPAGDPVMWYCAPAADALPHPRACLVTGITPQTAGQEGVVEAEFARRIFNEMMEPGTCGAGYNSLRFDDEFGRHLFYRNLLPVYDREYKNGNSRFDLIDLARMCYALRPDGIRWPRHESGVPSFRLEDLSAANGISHEGAHDALADVRATLDLARALRSAQPRLFDWALRLRQWKFAMQQFDLPNPQPVLHTSGRFPAERGCTTLVLPLALQPDRPKSVIVTDLMADPGPLLEASPEDLADLVFTPAIDLPEGVERVPLKAVHTNKVPMLAPIHTLRGVDTGRIALDPGRCRQHARRIAPRLKEVRAKVMEVFSPCPEEGMRDPDLALYSGGFIDRSDRALLDRVLQTPPAELAQREWPFRDPRLPVLLFRFRARNFPETLSTAERERWDRERRDRLTNPVSERQLGFADFSEELRRCRAEHAHDGRAQRILDQLESWSVELGLGGAEGRTDR